MKRATKNGEATKTKAPTKTKGSEKQLNGEDWTCNKFNIILVQILKHEWPARWRSFIPDLVAAAKTSETICENCMAILKVHKSWIPPWLSVHLVHSQRGRPTLDTTIQKAREKKAQFKNWVEPHIDTIKAQWFPTIKEWWFAFVTNIEPSVQLLATKTVDVFHASKKTIEPHIVKVQKTLDPYFMEAEKFASPYVVMMKPHVDKAHVFLKPYTKNVIRGYKKFMKAVPVYHRRVRVTIHELLKSHEFTKPIAINEVVWYMASALMALPVINLFNLISAVFSKKPKKRTRHSHSSHTRRRAKHVHPDKTKDEIEHCI